MQVIGAHTDQFFLERCKPLLDKVAIEEPLNVDIVFGPFHNRNVFPLTTVMRTPGHDDMLSVGLLFSLGIINSASDILDISHCETTRINPKALQRFVVSLHASCKFSPKKFQENMPRFSSCGVCSQYNLPIVAPASKGEDMCIPSTLLLSLPKIMASHQTMFKVTGGVHAAALFDQSGAMLGIFEDIGRHNALDKLIGSALLNKLPLKERILLLSSRASFEIVQKAARGDIPMVAVIGAVSSFAISVADLCGITLIGFLRDDRFNVYTHKNRIDL